MFLPSCKTNGNTVIRHFSQMPSTCLHIDIYRPQNEYVCMVRSILNKFEHGWEPGAGVFYGTPTKIDIQT